MAANDPDDSEEIAALVDTIKSSGAMIRTKAAPRRHPQRHVQLAESAADAVVYVPYRPGNFSWSELGALWPPDCAVRIARRLKRAQVLRPVRNLDRDPTFGID